MTETCLLNLVVSPEVEVSEVEASLSVALSVAVEVPSSPHAGLSPPRMSARTGAGPTRRAGRGIA